MKKKVNIGCSERIVGRNCWGGYMSKRVVKNLSCMTLKGSGVKKREVALVDSPFWSVVCLTHTYIYIYIYELFNIYIYIYIYIYLYILQIITKLIGFTCGMVYPIFVTCGQMGRMWKRKQWRIRQRFY